MFASTVEKVGSRALIRGSVVGELFRVVVISKRTAETVCFELLNVRFTVKTNCENSIR